MVVEKVSLQLNYMPKDPQYKTQLPDCPPSKHPLSSDSQKESIKNEVQSE